MVDVWTSYSRDQEDSLGVNQLQPLIHRQRLMPICSRGFGKGDVSSTVSLPSSKTSDQCAFRRLTHTPALLALPLRCSRPDTSLVPVDLANGSSGEAEAQVVVAVVGRVVVTVGCAQPPAVVVPTAAADDAPVTCIRDVPNLHCSGNLQYSSGRVTLSNLFLRQR